MGEAKRKKQASVTLASFYERWAVHSDAGALVKTQVPRIVDLFMAVGARHAATFIEQQVRALEASGVSVFDCTVHDTETGIDTTPNNLLWMLWIRDDVALDRLIVHALQTCIELPRIFIGAVAEQLDTLATDSVDYGRAERLFAAFADMFESSVFEGLLMAVSVGKFGRRGGEIIRGAVHRRAAEMEYIAIGEAIPETAAAAAADTLTVPPSAKRL